MNTKRMEEIIKITDNFLPKMLEDNLLKIQNNFKRDPMIYLKEFFDCLQRLFVKTRKLQEEGKKSEVAVIYFSFLYSNVLLERNGFRVETLDKELFLDKSEVYEIWQPSNLFEYVEADMHKTQKLLSSAYIRIKKYELWELRNSYLLNYYMVAEKLIQEAVIHINKMESYRKMRKCKEVKIMLGEYMNHPICIYTDTEPEMNI